MKSFVGCCDEDLKFEFPLVIGTYPIQNTDDETGDRVVTEQPTKMLSNSERPKTNESQNGEPSSSIVSSSDGKNSDGMFVYGTIEKSAMP